MPEVQPSGRNKLAYLSIAAEGGSRANLFRRRRLHRHSKVSEPASTFLVVTGQGPGWRWEGWARVDCVEGGGIALG